MPQQSQSLSGMLPPGAPIAGTLRQAEILIADLERMNYDATQYKSALSSLVDTGRNSQTREEVMRVAGSIEGVLGELQSLAKTTLSDKEPVEPRPAFGEISNSIQSLLQLGEENNIRVSPSLIENAFRAELAGDEGKAFNVLKSIEQEVQKGRDMQAEEEKENVTLADGSQISRGKKSGTLYRNGVPVSQGAINTGTYNKIVESITGVGGEEQALQSKPSIAFTASPETYAQEVQAEDTLSEKRKLFEKARESYRSGNDDEALSILFSLGAKNFLGESYTAADLQDIFGERNKKEKGGIEVILEE